MNKKNIFIVCFLFVLFGSVFIQYKNTVPKIKAVSSLFSVKQAVIIEGNKKNAVIQVKMGSNALQLLSSTHTVIQKGEKENAFITSIDERVASPEKKEFWAFYVNGKQAEVGAGSYILKNNDTIEWKIETY